MTTEEATGVVVGACGGAGATRVTVEAAATLARAGRDVAVVDVATGTQGLAGTVAGTVDPDLTAALLEPDVDLDAAFVELPADALGRVAAVPSRAPFERLARAGTADAARSLTDLLAAAAGRFDHVLVDAPPVTTNLAVAAVTATDRVAAVAPPGERGADAVQRLRGRLADVGAPDPAVVVNEGVGAAGDRLDADVRLPESDVRAPSEVPTVVEPDAAFAPAVAAVAETLVGEELGLEFPGGGLLDGVV